MTTQDTTPNGVPTYRLVRSLLMPIERGARRMTVREQREQREEWHARVGSACIRLGAQPCRAFPAFSTGLIDCRAVARQMFREDREGKRWNRGLTAKPVTRVGTLER